ncbi:hypothetical protein BH20ACT17_BH20ACT17_01670 [soil metagenome]
MTAAIDTDALLELVWAAPLAALSVTVAWGMVVVGTTRASEARREARSAAVALNALIAVAGALLFAAALVFGLIVLTAKD